MIGLEPKDITEAGFGRALRQVRFAPPRRGALQAQQLTPVAKSSLA